MILEVQVYEIRRCEEGVDVVFIDDPGTKYSAVLPFDAIKDWGLGTRLRIAFLPDPCEKELIAATIIDLGQQLKAAQRKATEIKVWCVVFCILVTFGAFTFIEWGINAAR